ncbi:MAG: phenylalanine--tRNA ligase subunit beta [Candidatus Wildermuthbacteria bacterium]|nr:phenylalanine--tRNA ligase subunit beta [Candidatus Wildermuthbacteria bacterium]
MLFSYNLLQEFVQGKLPLPEKTAELLAFHAFEVESIEQKGSDWVLDVSVLPQRGDCLSHAGLAREIAAMAGKELKKMPSFAIKAERGIIDPVRVTVAAKKLVPRYSALVLEGISLGPSPQWMQEYLEAFGMNSVNNVVDVTNLVMREIGQPLHAFDYNEIQGKTMTVRQARQEESLALLDDSDFVIPQGALVIQDKQGLIDLAGIRGGQATMITKKTKNIVLHAVSLDRTSVYKTKKALGYTTQAADIYSHELDPNLTVPALERALYHLAKFGSARIVQYIDIYPVKTKPRTVPFPKGIVERLLGIKIPDEEIRRILKGLGFAVSGAGVTVPTWRPDIAIPEDLVEEVGRMKGYHAIQEEFPLARIAPPTHNAEIFWQSKIQDAFKEAGFTETYNYSFAAKKDAELFEYSKEDIARIVELQNPISEDFEYMRSNLVDGLIKNVADNQKSQEDIRIFELGTVFQETPKGIQEQKMLASVVALPGAKKTEAFYSLKGAVDALCGQLGISNIQYGEYKSLPGQERSSVWHFNKSSEVRAGDRKIGVLGEISPSILFRSKILLQTAAFELDREALVQLAQERKEYRPPSRFPAVLRDIAVFVPLQTKAQDIEDIMKQAGGKLVLNIDLFDIYEQENMGENTKSAAFHVVCQAQDRTLTSQDADTVIRQITQALAKQGWTPRA